MKDLSEKSEVDTLCALIFWEVSMRKPYFKIFQDRAGEWRWTLYAANHEPVAVSEGYTTRQSAVNTASRLWKIAYDAVS